MDRKERLALRERAHDACELARRAREEARAVVARCVEYRLQSDDEKLQGRRPATPQNLHALERT